MYQHLRGRNIILGITGSIAAYKAAALCRILVREGAAVRVVMTALAKEFISPLTMATLSKNPILVDFFNPENGEWNSHVSLSEWADCYLIAPVTANTMGKMATGVADNLLLTTYLSSRAPVVVAPAMDLDMFTHPTTKRNMDALAKDGVHFVEPASGELASGLVGKGRMAEPEEIAAFLNDLFAGEDSKKKTLTGKKILVTAGATIEAIDPVRFISNHSTGKMGYSIAEVLAERGADVTLVSGRTELAVPKGVRRVDILSAQEMYEASVKAFDSSDGAVMCAAVADYTPKSVSDKKIKKGDGDLSISLSRTRDIAAELGAVKGDRVLVGFALESDDLMQNACKKLSSKNLDFIVLNSLRDPEAGLRVATNRVTIIDSKASEELPLMSKRDVAARIVDRIEKLLE